MTQEPLVMDPHAKDKAEVLEHLEELLTDAKEGRLISLVAVAKTDRDSETIYSFTGSASNVQTCGELFTAAVRMATIGFEQ